MWQIGDGKCPGLLSTYRRGGGRSSAPPFRQWLAIVNKLVVILGEDIEYKKTSIFIGSIVDSIAIVIICDLQGGRVYIVYSIRSVFYIMR